MSYPVLYSFRRCPYAMRARMAIIASGIVVELREVHLRNKPKEILEASPKATVPVLVLEDNTVIDESIDIMKWALTQNDPDNWFNNCSTEQIKRLTSLIEENDSSFKQHLDHYKYADRFPEFPATYYRQQGEVFLEKLNSLLAHDGYLFGSSSSLADIAIFPFIRQFAHVDKNWFEQSQYQHIQSWLIKFLDSPLFTRIMKKSVTWDSSLPVILLGKEGV